MWNMAKFINFAALVGPSSLFSYTDWYTLQWSIVNLLLFVDNMCCWSNKMPWHISSQIKSFVFNFTYHNYYLTNYRYTGLQYNYYLMVKSQQLHSQPSLNTVAKLYTISCDVLHFSICSFHVKCFIFWILFCFINYH
jgi:hypothetical protein